MGKYKLDGWVESEQLGVEVNGCCWHGCPTCFPDDDQLLPNGKTAGRQRELDKMRLEFIRQYVPRVDVYWECEIKRMLEEDSEMKAQFDAYIDDGPLNIRACFFGK